MAGPANPEVELLRRLLQAHGAPAGSPRAAGVVAANGAEATALESFVARGRASRRGDGYYLNEAQAHFARVRFATLGLDP